MGKLAVACNDRVISFYELHDHGGMQRWAVHPSPWPWPSPSPSP